MIIGYPAGQTTEHQLQRIIQTLNNIDEENLSEVVDLSQKIVKLPTYTVSGYYVDRGDPSSWDFTLTDLTTDGNWHDLDLGDIIPNKAKTVILNVTIEDDAAGSYISFRENGNSNGYNTGTVRTQVAGIVNDADIVTVCDGDKLIEYQTSNVTFTSINILVKGWIH